MSVPSVLTRSGVGEGPLSATGEGLLILGATLPSSSSASPSSPPSKSSTPWEKRSGFDKSTKREKNTNV